jgi:hypothetical protein
LHKSPEYAAEATMSSKLQARAKAFLDRPIPEGMPYVPDSLPERFVALYATNGAVTLDAELSEILDICVLEAFNAADSKLGEEAEFFRESAEILRAIQAEVHGEEGSPPPASPTESGQGAVCGARNVQPSIHHEYLARCRKIIDAGWYFIVRRAADICEIQVCDEEGRGESIVLISATATSAEAEGRLIPKSVIEAVQRLEVGRSDFCDAAGNRLDPFSMRVVDW